MSNIETVANLIKAAKQIDELFAVKIPKWQSDKSYYDKVRVGFNEGDNDGWYEDQAIKLHFGAWAGVYGSSSIYKEFSIDAPIFKEHFLKVLNSKKNEIMLAVSESIKKDAAKLSAKATEELNAQLNQIKELTVS